MKFKTREKLLNFRLDTAEYQEIVEAAEASDARSISEFIRDTVLVSIRMARKTLIIK